MAQCLGNVNATHCWFLSGVTLCLCAQAKDCLNSVKRREGRVTFPLTGTSYRKQTDRGYRVTRLLAEALIS